MTGRTIDVDALLAEIDEITKRHRRKLDDPEVRKNPIEVAASGGVALALGELGLAIRRCSS